MTKTAEKLKAHPAADAFPMMDATRLAELRADIQANGQREPVTICDGMILDGRNRYEACDGLGIEPVTRDFVGDPWAFAWSMNGARRDLDATVRALIFRRCEDGSAKRLEKISADGNAKRSEAAKGNTNASKEKTVADHDDPRLFCGKHVAREASRRQGEGVSGHNGEGRPDRQAARP